MGGFKRVKNENFEKWDIKVTRIYVHQAKAV